MKRLPWSSAPIVEGSTKLGQGHLLSYIEEKTGRKAEKEGHHLYRINPCPFCGHHDHFTIYRDTQSYSSFNDCCKGGTVIDFYIEYLLKGNPKEEKDKARAIQALKEYIGLEPENRMQTGGNRPHQPTKKEPSKNYSSLIAQWHKQVDQTDYFKKRGLTEKTINTYKLGFNPKGGEYGEPFQYLLPVSETFVIYREEGSSHGRYRNSKGEAQLLNLSYIDADYKHIFLTEGYIDALSLEELGYRAIALNSKENADRLTQYLRDHLEKAKNKIFIFVPDNDEPGQKLIEKLKTDFKAAELTLDVFEYDSGYKDINDYFKANKGQLEGKLATYLQTLGKNHLVANYLNTFLQEIQDNKNRKLISTGFLKLNEKLGDGLLPGLHVIGAIPSLGKTTFALQIADYIAKNGTDVLFFSLEMSKFELVAKSLSRELFQIAGQKAKDIGTRAIMKGDVSSLLSELKQALQNYEPTAQRLSILEGNFHTGVDEIREEVARHMSFTGEKPVVFVDYLQILKGKGNLTDKQEIDRNVIELKRLSRDFQIPVVGISSLNRQNYSIPIGFESFKESGSIEYAADTLAGLQLAGIKELDPNEKHKVANREKVNQMKNANPRRLELVLLKNRNGQACSSQEYLFYSVTNLFKEC